MEGKNIDHETKIKNIISKIIFRKDIKVAIRLGIRNEGNFLEEWIQHYISLGFNNFIIHDDNSTDNTKDIIDIYSKYINIIYIKHNIYNKKERKKLFDNLVFNQLKDTFDYILWIDIDEFLYINDKINIFTFLKECLENKVSVIQIPRFDLGDPDNYYNNVTGLESLKYNMINKNRLIKPRFNHTNVKGYTYETKCFLSPKNSAFKTSRHTSQPKNNTKVINEFEILKPFNIYYFESKVENGLDFNIRLYHFDTQNHIIATNNIKKWNKNLIHKNRLNKSVIKKKLRQLTQKHDDFILFFKEKFLFF